MAYTAALMYGAVALDAAIEGLLPGDPSFAVAPALVVAAIFAFLLTVGPRLPRWALALLGPLGVALAATALATTPGAGDGAVLYTLPVLWTSFFLGRAGAAAIVGFVALAHALVLLVLPAASSYPGRWVDVMVVVSVVALVVVVLEDRNESLVRQLAAEARTDALTGLLNRRGFDERAAVAMAYARRTGVSLAVVAFDIDYFKRVNDEWGHDVGDRVLQRIGELIAGHTRPTDVAARMGGEEFTVLLPSSRRAEAEDFSERVRKALAETDSMNTPAVRMSAGVAVCEQPGNVESCLQRADSALYEAKRTGRDRTVVFEQRHARPVQARGASPSAAPKRASIVRR
ncbi:MAG: GGDEF domain-containing protein [Solirubrobacteraceae bacterium]